MSVSLSLFAFLLYELIYSYFYPELSHVKFRNRVSVVNKLLYVMWSM